MLSYTLNNYTRLGNLLLWTKIISVKDGFVGLIGNNISFGIKSHPLIHSVKIVSDDPTAQGDQHLGSPHFDARSAVVFVCIRVG